MRQKQIVYRGVEYGEALRVVQTQRYERAERRQFVNGARAKAVFGPGVYVVSNPEVAVHYAICHAETMWDKAAVLRQELHVNGLFRLDDRYGENELRRDALQARHQEEVLISCAKKMGYEEWLDWTGGEIRAYLRDSGYRGIRYHISPTLTYYVCYEPQEQLSAISLFSVLDVREMN